MESENGQTGMAGSGSMAGMETETHEPPALDGDLCYRALTTRDARFDGRFYTCVLTTGIYCRPICPVRPPKREHCVFMPSAAAAHAAGYRPCLRCRPEVAPGLAGWRGTGNTVSRALALIAEGALNATGEKGGDVEELAEKLGVGPRHLRRLFRKHLGATPIAVAQAQRILFAKKLIGETALPFSEVALAAGFGSVRRFNDTLKRTYGRPPSALRKSSATAGGDSATAGVTLKLGFTKPFDWNAILAFLGSRAVPGVEALEAGRYRRSLAVQDPGGALATGAVEVGLADGGEQLLARIWLSEVTALAAVVSRLRRVFDLDADIGAIEEQLSRDPRLAREIAARPGLRVPGAWDPFELAVRAILGQQVSVAGARTLAARVVERCGPQIELPEAAAAGGLARLFPHAREIGAGGPDRYRYARRARACGDVHGASGGRGSGPAPSERESRGNRGAALRPAGDRPLDRAIHRHAGARRAGCLPGQRPRCPARPGRRQRRAPEPGGGAGACGGLAALAVLRRAAPLARGRSASRSDQEKECGMTTLLVDRCDSPVGEVTVVSDGERLVAVEFEGYEARMDTLLSKRRTEDTFEDRDDPQGFTSALRAYFDGRLDAIETLPAAPSGTPFQQEVWAMLREIPMGATWSYGELAARVGRPAASRAVGAANGLNPVAIVVPCHRVIGANGSLTGYGGGTGSQALAAGP